MINSYLSLIVLGIGALIYLLWRRDTPRDNDLREIGRIMFAFGLLVFLLQNGVALWK